MEVSLLYIDSQLDIILKIKTATMVLKDELVLRSSWQRWSFSFFVLQREALRAKIQFGKGQSESRDPGLFAFLFHSCPIQMLGRELADAAVNQHCEVEYKLRRRHGGSNPINPQIKV